MGSPKGVTTPTPQDGNGNLLQLLSIERVRSDKSRLTIAVDTEFFYENESVTDIGTDQKKVRAEIGSRNILSYQFALYAADGIHILEAVFIMKPITRKDGSCIYKRLPLSLCLGAILDLCTMQRKHVFEYRDTRRWPVAIKDPANPERDTRKLFKSPEEALQAVGALQAKYSDCLIDTSNVKADVYKNVYSDYMGERAINITILCHTGIVDLSAFAPERGSGSILKRVTSVQGGLVSLEETHFRAVHRDYWKFYSCMVEFRDTMCYASPKAKSLEALGNAVGIPKIRLAADDGEENAIKSKMDALLRDNKSLFLDYAANDALVTLVYASQMWGINREMPLTVSSAAAYGAYLSISDYMGTKTKADYRLAYAGLVKEIKGKAPMENRPGYMEVSNLEPYNHRAFLLLNTAANSYKGGYNTCTRVGWYDGKTYYDYDLCNAYPTSMCNVYDIDFRTGCDPLEYEPISNRELTLADFDTPYDPLFAYIKFEFPKDSKFPSIPISHEGSLIFPLTSEGLEGVYACAPDIYLALKMGARVFCMDGYRGRIRKREDGTPSKSLRESQYPKV